VVALESRYADDCRQPSYERETMTTSETLSESQTAAVSAAAARLRTAALTRVPCAPVRDLIGPADGLLAYGVQEILSSVRQADGARVVGHKIGLTSLAVQAQLGVDRPDFGLLFDDMAVPPGSPIDINLLMQPKIEAEIAFVLAADITDPTVTADGVRAAVAYASPALEIVDSRITDWDISFADTVADNASAGLFTLGSDKVKLEEFEPLEVSMTMAVDGQQRSVGRGVDCLGDPLNALAWLARLAVQLGRPLRAGQVVLSGALGPMVAVLPGAQIHAEIIGLGSVEATFTDGVRR
jgi:2-keto-4-pentenoate hydratase